ncbi:DUF1592 domain-containing protein [Marinagarivorans algicola]|uniref:DUF1592 domain-containing protein n=1 Tax=Marinagarivorans algicola TaxID=1513270 RepID=UPI0009EC5C67|nr:DUF1592 domain-containing protein [Marinagarivorans algicola]
MMTQMIKRPMTRQQPYVRQAQGCRLLNKLWTAALVTLSIAVLVGCSGTEDDKVAPTDPVSNNPMSSVAPLSSVPTASSQGQASSRSSHSQSNTTSSRASQDAIASRYAAECGNCHGNEKGENVAVGGALTASQCETCSNYDTLVSAIEVRMPLAAPTSCGNDCAKEFADYILANFAGYHDDGPDEVEFNDPGLAGDMKACEIGVDASYGGIKRLTSVEYNHLINTLFSDSRDFSENFSDDTKIGSFSFNTQFAVSEQQVQQYLDTAKKIAATAVENRDRWMPCRLEGGPSIVPGTDQCNSTRQCREVFGAGATDCKNSSANDSVCMCGNKPCAQPVSSGGTASADTPSCIANVLNTVVKKAYRRPLSHQEKDGLMAVYTRASNDASPAEGLQVMLQAVLSSPNFIYHIEVGEPREVSPGVYPLTQYELASRLAFYFWRDAPDDALLAAAAEGKLKTNAQIKAQAQRLFEDPRSKVVISQFHREWMHLQAPVAGDDKESLVRASNEDTLRTVQSLVYEDNASFDQLFTVSYGFLNDETKALYEVTGNASGPEQEGYARYELDASRRGGLLARAGFLNSNTPPSGRGIFIREGVLCGHVPPPPANVPTEIENDDPDASPREKWLSHISDTSCGGCHVLLDPLGFAFDHYDRDGKWRDVLVSISGKEFDIDDHGEVVATSDINGFFTGGQELQMLLGSSIDSRACYTQQWMRFATGRMAGNEDSCSLAVANQAAARSNYSIRETMLSVVLTDAFRYLRTEKK